jgi:DNA-directed RNA polymerase specialized sigma24 family protein
MASEEFLERIDREYGTKIKEMMRKMVGDDADYVYNSFLIRIWKEVDENNINDLQSFLMKVAKNECMRHLKNESKHNYIFFEDLL